LSLWVKLYGFQSIKNPVEILIDGYCTIGGESNLGKSAIVRAFHAAISNRAGTEFITEGEQVCDVFIKSLGHLIQWHKDQKSTFYEVDGIRINKPGRGTIPDEIKAAGLYAIKTLDKELHWPQIQFQWEQPFIIGSYTDTIAAELLGASQDTVKIGRAIKLVNTDVTKYKTRVELLEKQHHGLVTSVEKMEEIAEKLNVIQSVVDRVEIDRNKALKQESTYRDLVGRYRSTWCRWKVSSTAAKASVPTVLDVSYHTKLVDTYRKYTQACFLVEVSSKNQGTVPEILDGREYITEITRLYKSFNSVSEQLQIMGLVVSIPQIQRPNGSEMADKVRLLKELQRQFLKTQKDIDSHVRVTDDLRAELKKIDGEREKLKYFVGSIERCPLCLAPMKDGVYNSDSGGVISER
jgi:hypothetical protein